MELWAVEGSLGFRASVLKGFSLPDAGAWTQGSPGSGVVFLIRGLIGSARSPGLFESEGPLKAPKCQSA